MELGRRVAVYNQAREIYCDDETELDDIEKYTAGEEGEPLAGRFSEGDGGCWIQAWVWVPTEEEDDVE